MKWVGIGRRKHCLINFSENENLTFGIITFMKKNEDNLLCIKLFCLHRHFFLSTHKEN